MSKLENAFPGYKHLVVEPYTPNIGALIHDLAAHRLSYGVKPVTPEVLAAQQKIADKFFELKLVPKLVRVVDAAWSQGVKQIAGK